MGARFQPNYHEQQQDYRDAQDDQDTSRTMREILFPVELAQRNAQIASMGANLTAQTLSNQITAKHLGDQADHDQGYVRTMTGPLADDPTAEVSPTGNTAAELHGSFNAIQDSRLAHIRDAATIKQTAMKTLAAQREAQVRDDNGLHDDNDWADPVKRKNAYLNDAVGPLRRTLGAQAFSTLPMSDGRTAQDWINDPTSYSVSGDLLKSAKDELVYQGTEAAKNREMMIRQQAEAERKKSDTDIQTKGEMDVTKAKLDLTQPEREQARLDARKAELLQRAHQQAERQIAGDKIRSINLGGPKGDAMIDERAAQIYSVWAKQLGFDGAAPAAAPAAPAGVPSAETTITTEAQFRALPSGAHFVWNGKRGIAP